MVKPKFSIIIPVYNVENFLCECLNSVINQKNSDFEILLINDGSTDSSGIICNEYAKNDARIKVFHLVNRGVSFARNVGLEKASGKWILFLDSDDWISLEALLYLSNITENEPVEMVQFSFIKVYEAKEEHFMLKKDGLFTDIAAYDASNNYHVGICGFLIKSQIISEYKITFSENIKYAEDQEFILKCIYYSNSIFCSTRELYFYRMRSNSAMNLNMTFNRAVDYLIVVQNLLEINNRMPIFYMRQFKMLIKSSLGVLAQLDYKMQLIHRYLHVFNSVYQKHSNIFHQMFKILAYTNEHVFVVLAVYFLKLRQIFSFRE